MEQQGHLVLSAHSSVIPHESGVSPRVTGKAPRLEPRHSKSFHKPELALKPLVRNVNIFSDREDLKIRKHTGAAE